MSNFIEYKNKTFKELYKINESLSKITVFSKLILILEIFQILYFIIEPTLVQMLIEGKNVETVS